MRRQVWHSGFVTLSDAVEARPIYTAPSQDEALNRFAEFSGRAARRIDG